MEDRTPRPYASSDEDFEMVPDASGTKDTLTLTAAAELSHVGPTCPRATVACNITAAASEGKRRPDVDVVVVMDRSGSMEAERKLELCKETTELLIEQLRPTDRFGLVSFDHRVKTNTALVSASSDVARAVKSLRPGGTTNLSGGLFAGLGLLCAAPAAERIRAVLLLTDGLANAGITEEQPLIAATKSLLQGTSTGLYTFGYGSDHNAKLLQAIAGAAGDGKGSYYFIETAEKVVGAFADCLGGLLSVAAQNVVVEVKASAGRIARVRREGATRVDDRTWTVPLGDVFEEEQRDVLVEVELLGSQNVEVSFALRYVDATSGKVANATATASVAVDAAKAQTATPDAHVTEQRARLDTADALLSARECADRRDIAGARRVLESQKAKIAALKVAAVTGGLVERLAHDLAVVLEGLANEDAYRARGRQWMTSKMMGHQMQRCMEDSDSDEEEEGMPRLTGSVGRARNVYRNTSKKSSKVAMMRWMSARRPSAPQPTSATSSRPSSVLPPPAPAPRQGLFSSLFRKSQAPLEDQDLEE